MDITQGLITNAFAEDAIKKAWQGPPASTLPTQAASETPSSEPASNSFEDQFFPQYDPSTILEPVEAPKGKEDLVDSYRFVGDGKIYDFKKDTPREKVLEKIWDHNSPGLWGSLKGGTLYVLPADLSSALAYGLGGLNMDEMAESWRGYSDDLKEQFQKKYGQFMTPGFEQALEHGKVWDFATEALGMGIPYMGMALGGAYVGAGAAAAAGATGTVAAGLGAFLGSTAITSPAFIAQFADRQVAEMKAAGLEDAEDRIDWYKAAGLGTLASGLQAIPVESIFLGGPLLQMVTRWGAKTGTPTSARLLASIADVSGTNALAGAGTQYLSRLNADMPLLDDDAKSEYLDAAIAGSLVGVPFGAYRGIKGVRNKGDVSPIVDKTPEEIIKESEAPEASIVPKQDKEISSPTKDDIIYNLNHDYGIKNVEEAQEFLNNYKYEKEGAQRNALEDFVRIHGTGYSDKAVIDAARRIAMANRRNNILKKTPDGVMFPTIDTLPQVHSQNPKILTKAAYLADRYGYEDSFIKSLSDTLVEKLYKVNIQRDLDASGKNLPKSLIEEFHRKADELVDEAIIKEVEQYGSLYNRPEAKKRDGLSVAKRKELISKNPREELAKTLTRTRKDKAERDIVEAAKGKPSDRTIGLPDQTKLPEFIEKPPVDGESFSDYAGLRKLPLGPRALLEYNPAVTIDPVNMVDMINTASNIPGPRVKEKLSKQEMNEAIIRNPLIKKLFPEETLNEIRASLARGQRDLNKTAKENIKKQEAEKILKQLPDGTFARSKEPKKIPKEAPLSKNAEEHLKDIRNRLEDIALNKRKEILAKNPELGPALNDMAKRFAELAGETKITEQPITKSMQGTSKLLDSLANRTKVTKAMENAFLYIDKTLGAKFANIFDRVLTGQEVTPKQLASTLTLLESAFSFGDVKALKELNQSSIESIYKQIRQALPEKERNALDKDRGYLENWFKATKDINQKDFGGFKAEDLEAFAFSDYLRDSLVISSKQFRNSKQEKLFKSIETALKRLKKELNDQGFKSTKDLLEFNKNSGEKVPPDAQRPEVTSKRIIEEVMDKETREALPAISESVQRNADELNLSIPKNGFQEPPSGHKGEKLSGPLEENANNVGNLWHYFAWLRSMPSLAREVPIISEVYNNKLSEKSLASELQVRFSNKFSKAFDAHGGWQKLNDAHVILDLMRKSDQKLVKDDTGRLLFRNAEGKDVTLDHSMTKAIEDVLEIYREPYRAKDEILRNTMAKYFKDEGLTADSSLGHVKRVIDNYDQKIKGNPYPELAARYKTQKEALEQIYDKLQENDSIVNRDNPYVPYMRFGDYVVSVKDKQTGQLVHMESINEHNKFGSKRRLPNEKEKRQKIQDFYKQFDRDKYEVFSHQLTYNDIASYINKGLVSTDLIQSLLSSGINENMRTADHVATGVADPRAFFKDVSKDVEENKYRILRYVAARGAGKFGIKADIIPGYSKDWARVLDSFINIQANSLAKQAKLQDWGEIQAKLVKSEMPQHVRDRVNKYVDYINDPGNDYAGLRFFNFGMAMGARPASAILQLNTLAQQVPALGLEYSPNIIRNMVDLSKSIGRASKHVLTKSKLDPELQDLLDREPGFFRAGLMDDVVRKKVLSGTIADKAYDRLEEFAGIMIQPAERVTRIATFDFFRNMFKDRPETLKNALKQREKDYNWQEFWKNHKDRLQLEDALAVYSMLETHGVYGKEGRGDLQRGLGGSLLFPFTTYAQQMMEVLGAQLTMQRGLPGLYAGLWTMGTYLGLAGAAGIPAYELWKTLYEQYQSRVNNRTVDAEMEMKEAGVPQWMRKGLLSTATGLDLSSRVGQEIIAQNILEGIAKGEFKLGEVGGVPGRTMENLFKLMSESLNPTNTKSTMDLIVPVMPGVVQDVYKGYQMLNSPEDVLKTSTGKMLRDPSEVGLGDALTRAGGFGSLKDVEAREQIFWQQRANQEFNQAKSRMAEAVATARYKMALGARNGDAELQEEGREMLKGLQKELLKYAKDNKIVLDNKFWSSFNRNVNDRVWQKMNPGKIRKPTEGEKRHIRALTEEE